MNSGFGENKLGYLDIEIIIFEAKFYWFQEQKVYRLKMKTYIRFAKSREIYIDGS